MTNARPLRPLLVALSALALLLLAYPVGTAATAARPDPLVDAWERAREAGAYNFTADVEQTLIPRPVPTMIGQTDQRVDMRMEGQLTLPDQARIELRFEGAGLDAPALTLLRDRTGTHLVKDGEQLLVENPSSLSAPTADYLGYLAGAENARPCEQDLEPSSSASGTTAEPSEGTPACYRYDIDGPRFAEHVRRQMEAELRESERPLPPGLELMPSPLLQQMVGRGQLWVDDDGFPIRQIVDLEIPEVSAEYDVRAHVAVDFHFNEEARARIAAGGETSEAPRFKIAGVLRNLRGLPHGLRDG